ncbi:MAG: hypothetical protein IKK73_07060, partial [Akkermansia sp.]|nr:hypothetical protein [Akkermansia sp.]
SGARLKENSPAPTARVFTQAPACFHFSHARSAFSPAPQERKKLSVSIRCAINAPVIFHLSLLHGVQRNP